MCVDVGAGGWIVDVDLGASVWVRVCVYLSASGWVWVCEWVSGWVEG